MPLDPEAVSDLPLMPEPLVPLLLVPAPMLLPVPAVSLLVLVDPLPLVPMLLLPLPVVSMLLLEPVVPVLGDAVLLVVPALLFVVVPRPVVARPVVPFWPAVVPDCPLPLVVVVCAMPTEASIRSDAAPANMTFRFIFRSPDPRPRSLN